MTYSDEKNMSKFKKTNLNSWDACKNNIYIRLINKKILFKYGTNILSKPFLDLAMTISVQEESDNTVMSYLMTQEDLEKLNLDIDIVFKQAKENTNKYRKKRIYSFTENAIKDNVIYPIMTVPKNTGMMTVDVNKSESGGLVLDKDQNGVDNILVSVNKYRPFGSSHIACKDTLDEVYQRFNYENFYIVPISIHQCLFIKNSYALMNGKKTTQEVDDDLLEMLHEMNKKNEWSDVLSYKIYQYFGDENGTIMPISYKE